MELYLLLITAIGSCIAAFTGLLSFRSRYGLPHIQARLQEHDFVNPNPERKVLRRVVSFNQSDDPPEWLVCEVSISKKRRRKWCSMPGEEVRNNWGEFVGCYDNGDWKNRIKYDPPVKSELFLLHPDAPDHLWLSFRTILIAHPRIKRKVRVLCG